MAEQAAREVATEQRPAVDGGTTPSLPPVRAGEPGTLMPASRIRNVLTADAANCVLMVDVLIAARIGDFLLRRWWVELRFVTLDIKHGR